MNELPKIFEDDKYVSKYLKQAIMNDNIELELIFGETLYKNPLNKDGFKRVLEQCKGHYLALSEENSLDIRTQYKHGNELKISNLRSTVKGIDNIKQYCKTESLDDIEDVEHIQKTYFKDPHERFRYFPLKEQNYNLRLNLKNEIDIENTDYKVVNLLRNYKEKKKHFRYKKRFSFLTDDKLFRIDLSVVKSSKQVDRKYQLTKSFRESNILKNPEEYELEIEFIGNKGGQVNNKPIQDLYKSLKENHYITEPGFINSGNIYDPLGLGINIKNKEEEPLVVEDYSYDFDSPRYEKNTTVLQPYQVSSIKYSEEDYQKLLGKYVRIKDNYFLENSIDPNFPEVLKRYHQLGTHIGIVEDIYEELNSETMEYLGTKVKVKFYPEIANIKELIVPLKDLYGGSFIIDEGKIKESFGKLTDLSDPSTKPEEYENVRSLNEKNMFDLCQKLLDILETHVFYLSKVIYKTNILIPFKQTEEIIEIYKSLTNQKSKYFTFMGPQPVTLNHDNIVLDKHGSILVNYAVTEKADGDRYELFITDHHGYLINNKSEIIDTDTDFPTIHGEWLIDGEYITKDKHHVDIRLFVAFDIYWCGFLTPQPLYTYPFLSDDISRSEYLQIFNKSIESITRGKPEWGPGEKPLRFGIKEYKFGYLTNDEIDPKKLEQMDIMKIFEESKSIIDKDDNDGFEYRTDGLIYLPVNLPVKSGRDGTPPKNINGTWDLNFKWKPPEENTIDFMVKVKKELIKSVMKEQIYPYKDGTVIKEYKKVDLIVGYDIREDDRINFCMDILLDKEMKDNEKGNKLQKFEVDGFNETNLQLTEGKMLCKNILKDEIKDGDIVELRFNKDAENGMFWEPLRIRSDKLKPQFFTVANNVWSTIQNPVTTDMILGGYKDFEKNPDIVNQEGKYYISNSEDTLTESYPLRKLHNYIKSKLIAAVCSSFTKQIKVLDMSIGRGGDIKKYLNKDCNVKLLVGLDISSNYTESCKRFYYEKNPKPMGVFLRADTSKNIINGECCDFDLDFDDNKVSEKDIRHSSNVLSIIYDRVLTAAPEPIDKEYGEVYKKFKGVAEGGFDVVSSQFSMHYYFKTEDTYKNFLQNLVDNVAVGGYFIGTCYNGQKIYNEFLELEKKNVDSSTSEGSDPSEEISEELHEKNYNKIRYVDTTGNIVYSIEKKYEIDNFDYSEDDIDNMFGTEIDVYMDSIGQTITEYLVNFDFFKESMEKIGFELTIPNNINSKYSAILRKDYIEDGLGSFRKVIEKIPEIKESDKEFNKYYSEAFDITRNLFLQRLSSFNNYFIFQRKQ